MNGQMAIAALAAARMAGIKTFVVGIGTQGVPQTEQTLNAMADAGGAPRAGATRYYPVNSGMDLVTALGTIGGQIASCQLVLTAPPPDVRYVTLFFDGTIVPRDPTMMNGWDLDAGGLSITVYGSWCQQLRAGTVMDVQVQYGCPPPG
jgi:hypothetical protein